MTPSGGGVGGGGGGDGVGGADWLVVVDPQVVFADPATSPWGSPMWADVAPRVAELARSTGVAR